jgi:hypothetical protein
MSVAHELCSNGNELHNNGQRGCAYYPTAPEWVAGSEYSFADSAAYSEWQRHVRSPVAPKPTAIGSLGEILKKAGLFQKSTYKGSKYTLPSTETVLLELNKLARDCKT